MKKTFVVALMLMGGLILMSFTTVSGPVIQGDEVSYEVPAEVQSIIDKSCVGCHNSDSKNLKGKKKLSFDELAGLKITKQISKLEGIYEVLESGDMPPKKFLQKMPEAALTEDEVVLMATWASDLSKKMIRSAE